MNKKIYDDFTRLVIERIHGSPFEEAVYTGIKPITIGRVMQAFINKGLESIEQTIESCLSDLEIVKWRDAGDFEEIRDIDYCTKSILENPYLELFEGWKLINRENGQECSHVDQSGETILKLTKLLK